MDFCNFSTEVLGATAEDFFVVRNLLLEVSDLFVIGIHLLLERLYLILFCLVGFL